MNNRDRFSCRLRRGLLLLLRIEQFRPLCSLYSGDDLRDEHLNSWGGGFTSGIHRHAVCWRGIPSFRCICCFTCCCSARRALSTSAAAACSHKDQQPGQDLLQESTHREGSLTNPDVYLLFGIVSQSRVLLLLHLSGLLQDQQKGIT